MDLVRTLRATAPGKESRDLIAFASGKRRIVPNLREVHAEKSVGNTTMGYMIRTTSAGQMDRQLRASLLPISGR